MRPRRILLLPFGAFFLLALSLALACNLPPPRRPLFDPTSLAQYTTATPSLLPSVSPAPFSPSPGLPVSPQPTLPPGASTPWFGGLQTATPGLSQIHRVDTPAPEALLPPLTYWTQPGDTLPALAARFGVSSEQIDASRPLPAEGLLPFGVALTLPDLLGEPAYPSALLPDSAIVYSPAAVGFQIEAFAAQKGGFLSTYREELETGEWLNGPQIVQRVAEETSIHPQVLLTFLEYRSHWVTGQPADPARLEYPIGFYVDGYEGLYKELSLTAKMLDIGYYGWRQGTLPELEFPDHTRLRLAPGLNAGSVALEVLASKFYRQDAWLEALFGPQGLAALYARLFGDPWQAAARLGPLFPPGLAQPVLELPFAPGDPWSLTAGPHIAWTTGTPRGALDFAPITGEPPCAVSVAWATASAPGLVVRSGNGVVAIDLDGDGAEQTGWVLVYMHLADRQRVAVGTYVQTDDPLGHPSCEGGRTTGTHVHLARKYNGEWLAADGPFPLVLSGWRAKAGPGSYDGSLEKDGRTVTAHPDGSHGSSINR